ncbi:MAG: glutamate synthase large subunit [Ruminococcus callidus]|nr:glutamate synthase large subunit [Ruminococcus sp.]MDY6144587.1 glutamate synthase large subunit [Ruminococcus callidus]MCI7422268.1 glutamate synthase large subunit [Ruminococcus sp.]MCI7495607.1 glutamate synthase large subunit [Ruminococcus sp.]MDD6110341.1 glutamate synthase large subunit [Ruminococcus sp.]
MDNYREQAPFPAQGLYDPRFEHENCGIGAVVNMKGETDRSVVDNALKIVETLEHRAGKDAEGKTGDGVGILLQISHTYFSKVAKELNIPIGDKREYGIGMFFFPQTKAKYEKAMKTFEQVLKEENLEFLGWREVPVNPSVLGSKALESMPHIMQAFIKKPKDCEKGIAFDRKLYVARMVFEKRETETYVVSCSSRTIVYKGMFLVKQLRLFYEDLNSPDYHSAIGIVHSRFSTNTNPSWQRSHPNRMMVHNGEINTITGNVDKMLSRENILKSDVLGDRMKDIVPMLDVRGSDSARLDNTLEFMMMSGMDLPLAVMATIPEPWQHIPTMSREKKAFYQYYATMMEPWDGPASIIFTDGDIMGAVLDRNGLRPSRYYLTDDGKGNRYLILSSEVGALEIPSDVIVKKERLHPGKMLLVDTVKGELIEDETLKNDYAKRQPYGEWLDHNLYPLADLKIPNKRPFRYHGMELKRLQRAFGYTYETMYSMMIPMALNGGEPTAAMGVDVPIPPLSKQNPPLFDYFKQLFAQVTNPPIDSIRESVITDTTVYLGAAGNLLKEEEANCRVLKVENPILTSLDLMKIRDSHIEGLQTADISMLYTKDTSLADAISNLYAQADAAHDAGAAILILTDRGVDQEHLAIPSLLAVAALETYLVRTRKNTAVSLIVETAEPTEVHHFATLLGFGASAVNPYLALDTLYEMTNTGELDKDYSQASKAYIQAVVSGIVKIASKMGISTIQSYQGSKIFEALGIAKSVCEQFFPDTVSRVGGIDLQDISNRSLALHDAAFDPNGLMTEEEVRSIGTHKARSNQEEHLYNPETIHLLQQATWRDDYNLFKQYTACLNEEHKHVTLRSTLDFRFAEDGGIPLEEVESVESIMRRFKTGAMSYGSISQEAHECMAMAMNRIGGKSNSGEGGEDLERIVTSGSAVDKCSAIKQVASGRFGVTSKYLTSAKEIQIKMAQGAKPGEGGHLPAKKVYPWIAKTRHSTPGVALISPPPHHDIYSIEDLAQLIYDLKNANKRARISVKLVSEAGVGTIAAGVAKAGAGVILISGYDGGTGAAPSSSIHNAGLPWELGLAETHQTLIMNGLRSKVVIETDGKMMTGRDVIIAAMLGAEEYGFATAPLVTMGCVMMRVCNLDTCPAGVATQNPELRKRFKGKPEYIINFMRFIAQEMREYMAKLGIRTMDELIGRSDLLVQRSFPAGSKESKIDMSNILTNPYVGKNVPQHFHPKDAFDFKLAETIDETTIIPAMQEALAKKKKKTLKLNVSNLNRTLGTLFGAEITRKYYNTLEEDTFTLQCKGSGGQSFGAFIPKGLTLELEGDSNDYFGKGLSGGTLVVYPPKDAKFQADENIIIGNVALFGATSGKAFIAGVAGERFCVRNSGATVVVEGVGDHGCEYMTGGCAVILGKTSKNFAAGMSGGIAYVLDEESDLYTKLNKALVGFSKVTHPEDVAQLKELITEHVARTHSVRGQEILDQFDAYLPKFKKIVPHDYAKMLRSIRQFMDQGLPQEEAKIEAFYVNTK